MSKQTLGTPDIQGTTVDELRHSTQFWMQQLFNHVDQLRGARGTPTFLADVDMAERRIMRVGVPVADDDAEQHGLSLGRPSSADAYWDAQFRPIINLPQGTQQDQSVNLSQIQALLRNLLNAATAQNAPPEVEDAGAIGTVIDRYAREDHTHSGLNLGDAQTITGAKTFDLDPAAPFAVTAGSAVVANLDADKVDGLDSTDLVLVDGTQALTAAWDAGSFQIRAETFQSDIATGTAPLTVASTTVVTNLNADQVDGLDDTDIVQITGAQTVTGVKDFSNGLQIGTNETISTYDENTFTITGTGFAVNPTGTARYVILGNMVILFIPQLTGTSNAVTFTLTGVPAAIRTARDITCAACIQFTDNGTASTSPGVLTIRSGATAWDLYTDFNSGAWTAANTKTLQDMVVAYHLI